MSRSRSDAILDVTLPTDADVQRERREIQEAIQDFLFDIQLRVRPDVFQRLDFSLSGSFSSRDDMAVLIDNFFTGTLDKLDSREFTIIVNYADYARQLLSFLVDNKLITGTLDGLSLMKFVCISLYLGPDRALKSLGRKDAIWREFRQNRADLFYTKLADMEYMLGNRALSIQRASIRSAQDILEEMRQIYYTFLRDDDWDPRKAEETAVSAEAETTTSSAEILDKRESEARMSRKQKQTAERSEPRELGKALFDIEKFVSKSSEHSERGAPSAPARERAPAAPPSAWTAQQPVTFEYRDFPEYVYRQNTPVDSTAGCAQVVKALEQYHIPATSALTGMALGVSSGVASGIGHLTKEGKERSKPVLVPAPRPSLKDDMRVSSFDYNIYGTTVDDILGSVFRKTCFINEGARQETMKVILQRVLDDPDTPNATKEIALKQIDQMDVPRMHAQMSHLSALRAAKVLTKENADLERVPTLIPPPTFGNQTLTTNTVKSLFATMGIDSNQKFSIGDPECKPLKYYLIPLAAKITADRLSEDQAYLLLSNIVTGTTLEQVQNAMYDDNIPFKDFWVFLQKTGNRATSVDTFQKELDKLLKTTPVHVEDAITRIKNLRIKIHMNEPDEMIKKKLTETNTILDFRRFLRNHFPHSAPLVDFLYKQKVNAQEMEALTNGVFDAEFSMPNKVYSFMEVMCSVLVDEGKMSVSTPSLTNSGFSKQERAKVSAIAPEKSQQKPKSENKSEEKSSKKKSKKGKSKANVDETTADVCSFNPQFPQYRNDGNRNNNYRPQQRPQNSQNMRNDLKCDLCGMAGHHTESCWTYPGQQVSKQQCSTCTGFHPGPCLPRVSKSPRPAPSNRFGGRGGYTNRYSQPRNDEATLGLKEVGELIKTQFEEYSKKLIPLAQGLGNQVLGNQGQQMIPPTAHLSSCQFHP